MGLEWTLALIDEDVELRGYPYNHALARAGVIDHARGQVATAPMVDPPAGP